MKITDDNLPVLQNLEFSVVQIWRANPVMSDYSALRAYETAFQMYRAELRGHVPKPSALTGLDELMFQALKAMCEFQLGRGPSPIDNRANIHPISLELLMDCLRELGRSTERHTKAHGRQGYLTFIDEFVP